MIKLFEQFLKLPCPSSADEFTAVPLWPNRKDFLAMTTDGAPVFLLHDAGPVHYVVGRRLKHLAIEYHATCRVRTEGMMLDGQFALINCGPGTSELYEIFVRCVGAAVAELPVVRTTSEIEVWVSNLVDLFRSLSEPSTRELVGLWAELWVISNSGAPARAVERWHQDGFERFDFSTELSRIEVKATTRRNRIHQFALEQLRVPPGGVGFVISLLLQPLAGGASVLDLAKKIHDMIPTTALQTKLWRIIFDVLGSGFSDKLDKRFDLTFAQAHSAVYAMSDVPRIDEPNDTRVSEVKFTVDFTSVPSSLTGSPTSSILAAFSMV